MNVPEIYPKIKQFVPKASHECNFSIILKIVCDIYWLASIACILVILNINSLAGPIWMYRLSRSFPMRYKRMLQVSWRVTWPESSLTSPGKTQSRATARSPTTNTAQTWETSCRRIWTGSVHRKTERETTGEWYLFSMIAYKQNIYKILSCNCYHTWSFYETNVDIFTLMCITNIAQFQIAFIRLLLQKRKGIGRELEIRMSVYRFFV